MVRRRDRELFVCGFEVDAFADELHVLVEVFRVGNSSEDFTGRQGGRYFVVRVVPGLGDFVRPNFRMVGNAIDSCFWDLVSGSGAGVDEEFAEVVDLSDLFFLRDSESSRRYLEFVANDLVDLFFGVWTVGPSSRYLACFRVGGGFVDRGVDFVAGSLGHLFL